MATRNGIKSFKKHKEKLRHQDEMNKSLFHIFWVLIQSYFQTILPNKITYSSLLLLFIMYLDRLSILFLDRAVQHYRSIKVRKYLEENKDVIRVEYLPKRSPGFSAVEECWRKGKDDLLVSILPNKITYSSLLLLFIMYLA